VKTWTLALFFLTATPAAFATEQLLWEIGKPDHDTAKFALGPKDYKAYRQPGLFVIGHSDPKKDWPYVQPGVIDGGWAPGAPQTFEVFFALTSAPPGPCRLELHLADTHSINPPRVRVEVGAIVTAHPPEKADVLVQEYQTPKGGGDASVFGDPAKGRPHVIRVDIPTGTLKTGVNRIAITTVTGSWILWDAVRFYSPDGVKLAEVHDFMSPQITGPSDRLLRHEGRPVQPVTVRIFHRGEPTKAVLTVGTQPQEIQLQAGMQTVEHFLPAVEKAESLTLSLTVDGKSVGHSEITLPVVRKWEIYVLMHSHNDIGYTDIQPNIAKKQAGNVLRALDLIRQTQDYPLEARFKWNLEVLIPYENFREIATPEQMRQFEQAVRNGGIGVEAMYANLLTGVCRGEELIRQFAFATALGRRCGVKVDAMSISDVPGLTWGVVPAMVQNGVKYISNGPNANWASMDGDRIGYVREQWEHNPFWWESPSGKEKVLYWGAQGGYSIGHGFHSIAQAVPHLLKRLGQVKYPYDIVQLRWSKGDNGPADEGVMDAVKQWNAKYAYPRLIIATTSEAFHEFDKRYGDKLPTFRGDLTPYWEDGAGSGALETALNRHSADRLLQAETLWAMHGRETFPAGDFADAWKNVALWSEHTWGAHNSISQPDAPFVKTQWKYKRAFALNANSQATQLLSKSIGPPGKNLVFDVYNTSCWPRSGLVTLPSLEVKCLKDDAGHVIPCQILANGTPGGETVFLARDVPPFGAKRFTACAAVPATGSARAEACTLSTSTLTVKVDATTGVITSLTCQGIPADLANGAINNYTYLPGSNVKDAKPNGPAKVTVKNKGPLMASLLIESDAPGCQKLVREVRVIDGLNHVEIIDMVDKLPVRAVEGVHLGFSFNVPNPVVHVNSPGAVGQPEKDQLPGACKNWFSVERWVDVSNDKYGVTWVTADAPLVELGGLTANLPRSQPNPNAYLKHIESSATLYSWVMNNHWHTNYRADQAGKTYFNYYLRPHLAYDPVAAAKFGIETTLPLLVKPATDNKPLASRLRVEPADVLVSALKPSDDGRAIIVRLYGASGKTLPARLTWSDPQPRSLSVSDASELPGTAAGESIEVPGWGYVTVRAEMK